ncbi:MAG: DAK2 domain-containing protein [Clostridia bacterium]|nr:DAK2 domain-containing protein [Clostridia bacterium]
MDIINGELLVNMLVSGSVNLANNMEDVNRLNVFPVPDGDTGTNMSMTFSKATTEIQSDSDLSVGEIGKKISSASLRGARGNSGVILSQFIRGISKGLKDKETATVKDFAIALAFGTKEAYQAVMKPTEGTILTVMRAISDEADRNKEDEELKPFLDKVIKNAKVVLDQTPEMLPKLKQAGVVDAGGMGLIIIFEGMKYYLDNGVIMEKLEVSDSEGNVLESAAQVLQDEEITFGYCTEFIIRKEGKKGAAGLRNKLEKIGDSVVVVEDDDIIKVHVHTDNPDMAIGHGLKLGSLINIKIDNMRYQNEQLKEQEKTAVKEKTKYGFVAVASGEGFKNIYNELGITGVIFGGQSMNPSTDDILEAAKEVNAETVFVFPNNKNIILAASQAKDLFDGNLIVIPTISMAQVFSLMLLYDENLSAEELEEAFNDGLSNVKTAQITYAVRDSVVNDIAVLKDDIMGMIDDKLTDAGRGINEITLSVIDKMTDDFTSVITVYKGSDISDKETNKLVETLTEKYPDCDISLLEGGQPIYYYIISAE